jgi:hypothetical protein
MQQEKPTLETEIDVRVQESTQPHRDENILRRWFTVKEEKGVAITMDKSCCIFLAQYLFLNGRGKTYNKILYT